MTTTAIDKYSDVIDSRDIIERIADLDADRDAGILTDAEKAELTALEALAADAEGYCDDWKYGASLIRDSYFCEYAQELADEMGALKGATEWPLLHIDWDAAAEELKQDYTSVEFDGVTYWIR